MAERSKAHGSGPCLFGGVGSNPTSNTILEEGPDGQRKDSGGQQVGGETPWDQTRNSRRQAASGGLRGAWLCEGGRAGGIELVGGGWV